MPEVEKQMLIASLKAKAESNTKTIEMRLKKQ